LHKIRFAILAAALATASGCHDAASPPRPASISVVAGDAQVGVAGQKLSVAPAFVVKDDRGHPLAGVSVAIAVTAGNGILTDAPRATGDGSSTPVGIWSMGARAGVNQITVTVAGLTPLVFTATSNPGAPAKLVALTPQSVRAPVATTVTAVGARLTDGFDNPIPTTSVQVAVTGGSIPVATLTSDAQGLVNVDSWQLGTVAGQSVLTLSAGAATVSFIADIDPGPPASVAAISGAGQPGRAGATVDPIQLRVSDRYGNGVPNVPLSFNVTSGAGTLGATSATTSSLGVAVLPAWTLGRTALPQRVHATAGDASADIEVAIKTDFNIDIRFWGPTMPPEQQALFTNAAARLSAIITGDVPDMAPTPINLAASCGIFDLPTINEPLDDIVIYASIQDIDGPSKILAQAGPCLFRNASFGGFAAYGIMEFDRADIDRLAGQGNLQDVITHEMLHVLGIGTAWQSKLLLSGAGTAASTYLGSQGIRGCVDDGGTSTCATGVPVENNGVPGTADGHWRETTFQSELMTGYASAGVMPLSGITVGALADLGYVVNPLAADPYRVPTPTSSPSAIEVPGITWERGLPTKPKILP
jgi:hypothetical protein